MLQINFVMFLKMFQYFNVAYVSLGMLQCFTECFRNQTECFGNQLDVACNKSDSDGVEYHWLGSEGPTFTYSAQRCFSFA